MKEIIQDIRIVSRYKQHYFDKYNTTMHTDYSCWGYYDGISIVQIDTTDDKSDKNISHLFEKRSKACISPVWCGTVHNAEDLNGTFSKQNIGIFRCYDVTGGITWEQNLKIEKTSPYFALAFLQLSSREQYSDLETKIKNMSTYVFDTFAPYVFFNTYHTYDNADLIILLYSNSLKEINNALASLENDKEYLLSTDKAAIESALDITLPAIGATEASIDFSGLIAKLRSKEDGATSNKIMIVPQANNRWSSEKTNVDSVYTFTCNKPEFSIAVQEGNVWTKTFTIDEPTVTAGDAEVLKKKLVYQYKEKDADDNAWQKCSGDLEQIFSEAPSNKDYQVRAFYREGIVSDVVDVTLETPEQLPNSDMEEWQAPQLDSFVGIPNFWDKFYCYDFLPYKNGENDIWWSTNNKRSQDYTIARVKVTSSPCVSYSENVKNNGSRSTLIYTSGHGGEWASTSTELYSDGAFAGSLFIGKYNWNWDNSPQEEIISGHIFSSRPTSFKFWYKYIPKKSDAFKAYIELRNGDEVIASGTFIPETISSETDWIQGEITLDYGDSPKSATSIYVQFLSTTKTSFSEDDFDKNKSITFPVMGNWNAHIGSMLYIDDLSLIYDK